MDDERYLTINGRRWRRSDPAIPEKLRAELVAELMDARRAVGAGQRAGDDVATKQARARVQDAKVALGERGRAWWEERDEAALAQRAMAAAATLLRHRGGSTICPSDVARVVGGEHWRSAMGIVREAINHAAADGVLVVRQKGEDVVDPTATRGPVRVAQGHNFPSLTPAGGG